MPRSRTPFRHVSSRHYLSLFERHASFGSWALDVASGTFEWSDGLHRIMRTNPSTFRPSLDALTAMVDPDDRWMFLDKFRDVSDLDPRPVRMTLPGGTRRWQVWSKDRVDTDIDEARLIVGIVQDVTEQKNAVDAELQRQRLVEMLVTLRGGMLWRAEPDGSLFFEIGWCEFTGTNLAENRNGGWLDRIHPEDRVATESAWRTAVGSRTLYSTVYRVRRFDGIYQRLDVKATPMLDSHGAVLEWVGYCGPVAEVSAARPSDPSLNMRPHPTGPELRAARALLGWTVSDLARISGISTATITRHESVDPGRPLARSTTQARLLKALVAAGIEFIDGDDGSSAIRHHPGHAG